MECNAETDRPGITLPIYSNRISLALLHMTDPESGVRPIQDDMGKNSDTSWHRQSSRLAGRRTTDEHNKKPKDNRRNEKKKTLHDNKNTATQRKSTTEQNADFVCAARISLADR